MLTGRPRSTSATARRAASGATAHQQLVSQFRDRNPVFRRRPGPRHDPLLVEQADHRTADLRGRKPQRGRSNRSARPVSHRPAPCRRAAPRRAAGRNSRAAATSSRRRRRRHRPAPAAARRADARCRRSAETASDRNAWWSSPARSARSRDDQDGSTCAGPQRPSAPVCDVWIGAADALAGVGRRRDTLRPCAPATGRLVCTPPGVPVTSPLSLTSASGTISMPLRLAAGDELVDLAERARMNRRSRDDRPRRARDWSRPSAPGLPW